MNALPALLSAVALAAVALAPAADAAKSRADLSVPKLTASPREVARGASLTVSWTVKNGGLKAAGKSSTQLALSTDAKLDAKDIRLATVVETAIKPRKVAAHTLKVTVPASTVARSYSLLVCADARAKVAESGEKNNCRAAATVVVTPAGVVTPSPVTQPGPRAPVDTPSSPPADAVAPVTTITEAPPAVGPQTSARFAFTADRPGATFECRVDDDDFAACASPKTYTDVLAGFHVFEVRATDPSGAREASPARKSWRIEFEAPAPGPSEAAAPPPETKASTAPAGEMTLVGETTEFLYTGADPIQKAVAAGAIKPDRAAVLRGRVLRRNGSPVDGVRVTVVDHPELGRTATRADGGFELAVNGGGSVALAFEREGYVPSQRQLEVPTQEFERVEEIVLVPYDDQVTGVDLGTASDKPQVAQSAAVTDEDGTRKATLLLEPGTDATATLPDGSEKPLGDRLNIRATEFTIGDTGAAAMPGELPPTSAYTYAVEYSVDEASKLNAVDVQFDKPVVTYVDNYLKFPAGTAVPMGYYDRETAQWVPAPSGVVIAITGESGGRANVDVDGDGVADTGAKLTKLGIDDGEREKLAELYDPGKSLWRSAIDHFTPWDYNWPYGLPDDADGPDQDGPDDGDPPGDDPCKDKGSIILCEDQVLGEQSPVAGTDYVLAYQSDRVPGRRTGDSLEIPLTGAAPPASLARVELAIEVAGRTIRKTYTRAVNLTETFVFDGLDAYGRAVQGRQAVDVTIDYVYAAVYRQPGTFLTSFAAVGGQTISGNRTRNEISVSQRWSGVVGGLHAPASSLAGWNVNVHHAYDPVGRTLYLGDGSQRSAEGQNFDVISTAKAGLDFPEGLTVAPDGALLVADSAAHVVRRVLADGSSTVVAGTGAAGFGGDGGPATAAALNHPSDVALAADGTMVVADEGNNRIREVSPDGVIRTVAGRGGAGGYSGDGGPAADARLDEPSDVAVDADGALYIVDRANHAVRRVGSDGVIATLAGNGSPGFAGDGGVATSARLRSPRDVALRADGSVFIADAGNHRVRRIDADGRIETVAGNGAAVYSGDGGLAVEASLDTPSAVLPLRDGGLIVADAGNAVLRKVGSDATIATVAGNGTPGFRGDGGPAAQARIDYPQAVALGTDDTIYLSDAGNNRVRALSPSLPGLSLGEFTIPSSDGGELYVFDRSGRHLRTVDTANRAATQRFRYDTRGRLSEIEDANGLKTTVTRNAAGVPTAIVGPYGQVTALQVSPAGYLTRIESPAGDRLELEYNANGLLTRLTDPRDGVHRFEYDALGRLTKDVAADGSAQTLARSVAAGAVTVVATSGEGRKTTYRVKGQPDGSVERSVTDGDGRRTLTVVGNDGVTTLTQPDGTRVTEEVGPDPRFGMQSPVNTRLVVTNPSGLRSVVDHTRTVSLDDASDPLSLRSLAETTSVNGRITTTRYDATTRRVSDEAPSGRSTSTELDDHGRPVRVEAPNVTPAVYTYDARGRLSRAAQGARVMAYTYDARGRMASITDPLNRRTEYSYDLADRATAVKQPDGRQVALTYDRNGNVLGVAPPGGASHTFAYTSRDLLSVYTPPLVGATSTPTRFTHDRDELLTTILRPDGGSVAFAYGDSGQLKTITQPRGTTTFAYGADTGMLTSATAPGGEQTSFTYDGSMPTRISSAGTVAGQVSYTYDADFRVASQSIGATDSATYAYDGDGLLTRGGGLTLTRDPVTGLVSGASVNSSTTTVTRNAFAETDSVLTRHGSASVYGESYVRDGLGRITAKTETRGATNTALAYTFNASDRLGQVTRNGTVAATYTYDDNGNRTSVIRQGEALPTTADYDAQDRLTRYGTTTYTYTPSGELRTRATPDATTSYDYDALGALTNVTLPNGAKLEYAIDPSGRRVAVKREGVLERGFLYGPGVSPLAELNADGTVRSRFLYITRSNVPDIILRAGRTFRVISDQLGSPRSIVDTVSGAVAQELDYDEFGRVTRDTSPGFQPFGFAGGLYDRDTGLVRFGARDYDPEVGRFTAPDPLRFEGGDTNLYAYVGSDPVNAVDPLGLIIEAPGAWESLIPIWGPGRQAIHDFQCGNYLRGAAYAGMAALDVFAVKALVTAAARGLARKAAPAVARNGETSATAYGRKMHQTWDYGQGFKREFSLPSGRRADAVNLATREVVELKPNNPRAIAQGYRQLEQYATELEGLYPGTPFTRRLVTYTRP